LFEIEWPPATAAADDVNYTQDETNRIAANDWRNTGRLRP